MSGALSVPLRSARSASSLVAATAAVGIIYTGLLYTARRIIRLPYIRVLYPYIMDPLPYGYYIRLYTAVCLFGLLW